MTDFEKQVKNLKLVVDDKPRTYIRWTNTEEGRQNDNYERIELTAQPAIYVNENNRADWIHQGCAFWDTLERLYKRVVAEQVVKTYFNLKIRIRQDNSNSMSCMTIEAMKSLMRSGHVLFNENKDDDGTIFLMDRRNNNKIIGIIENE